MKARKILKIILIIIMMITFAMPEINPYYPKVAKAATFEQINDPAVFLKQKNGDKECTLVATTMLVRRTSMMLGNKNWADITVDKVKKEAWIDGVGLKYSFTYEGITVNKASFASDPEGESIALLEKHPEGIVLYDQIRSPRSHAILLTDYRDNVFYCAEPAEGFPTGRIPNSSALVQVREGEHYYYVSSPSVALSWSHATEENQQTSLIDISGFSVELSNASYIYEGKEIKPEVNILGLTENIDYTISYYDNINPGLASVVIRGMGVYSGTIATSFEIKEVLIPNPLDEINIVMAKQSIKKGKTTSLIVTLPETLKEVKTYSGSQDDIIKEVKITYKSSSSKIASINSKGKITGKKKGTATIYVTAELADTSKKTFTLKIKVK